MTYPAPKYLKEDPWFGTPVLSEKQLQYKEMDQMEARIEEVLDREITGTTSVVEPPNIHEIMYNMSVGGKATTLQLDPMPKLGGGSESIQSGPGGWQSGTGYNQFRRSND
tara:strand:- start:260 stop:589 length:330 start_codon:yes stop_codon:yes gene_type:complete